MRFEFATAGRIIFGCGSSQLLPDLARGVGGAALLVVGRDSRRNESLIERLGQAGISKPGIQRCGGTDSRPGGRSDRTGAGNVASWSSPSAAAA